MAVYIYHIFINREYFIFTYFHMIRRPTMQWKKIYEERKLSAADAVKLIKSGDRVILGHCISEPTVLVDAMVDNAKA